MTKSEDVIAPVTIVSCPKCQGGMEIRRSYKSDVPARLACQKCGYDANKKEQAHDRRND